MTPKPPHRKPLLALVGPTAVGKTAAALNLAQKHQASLLSVDSQQVYRGMDIGTGKEVDQGRWIDSQPWPVLQIQGVDIYGLDLTTPDQPMNVSQWRRLAYQIIDFHHQNNQPLILVGGTGLYLQSLITNSPEMNIPRHDQLRQDLADLAPEQLFHRLAQLDDHKAQSLNHSDRHNTVRLIRAIEVATYLQTTPQPPPSTTSTHPTHPITMVGLTMDRRQLYQKADRRVDHMFSQGLVDEVANLIATYGPNHQAFRAIGYAQVIKHLQDKTPLDQTIQEVKFKTHSYIRRQYTWFKKQPVHWSDTSQDLASLPLLSDVL